MGALHVPASQFPAELDCSAHRAYPQLIPLLTELARNAVKEKVVRIVLATFRVRWIEADLSLVLMCSHLLRTESSYSSAETDTSSYALRESPGLPQAAR